jgi:tetratricopeptide (TPR) repeat protein
MAQTEKSVFISYRRTNFPWALAVFQNLQYYGFDVFLDFSGITSGDFEQIILGNIAARAHFLVLLTPSALEGCDKPGDWLRREIEAALEYKRNIVPLLLEGFSFASPSIANQLTGTLEALKSYSGPSIPPEYFQEAMARLREKFLNVPLSAVLHPKSLAAENTAKEQKAAAGAALPVQVEELTAQRLVELGIATTKPEEKRRLFDEAILLTTEAIRLNQQDTRAYKQRGSARGAVGDFEGAKSDYLASLGLPANFPVKFDDQDARKALQRGDVASALKSIRTHIAEAVELRLADIQRASSAALNRAEEHYKKGQFDEALTEYNEAIRLLPRDAGTFARRGTVRWLMLDDDGALKDLDDAIRLMPNEASFYNARSEIRKAAGDVEGALRDKNEATRLQAGGGAESPPVQPAGTGQK